MSTDKPVRIGVLGIASIARRMAIPAIQSASTRFRLAGLASRDASKAREAAAELACPAYDSYEALLEDPSIDAVYIPLPNGLHYQYVMQALRNRKHVWVEKSLGCDSAEVEEMVRTARDLDLVLLENFQFRKHSQLSSIRTLLRDGVIGELRSVRVSFGFPPFKDAGNIRYDPALKGGALLDAGAYPLKIAPYFLGEDIEVTAASLSFDPVRKVDIWGGGMLTQKHGPLFCHFGFGFDHHYQCALELWGSTGKLFTNRIFTAPPGYSPRLLIETAQGTEERVLPPDDHFVRMLEHFHDLIRNDRRAEDSGNLLQASLIERVRTMGTR
jgi:NDP-hexose-3-ketoreductase